MDNPYHKAEMKPHYLDRATARIMCFDIFNIFAASHNLASEFEFAEAEHDPRSSSNFKLHHELAEPRLSQLLLQLAVFVRTFDDIFAGGEHAETYAKHVATTQGEDFIGVAEDGGDLRLREACNKIIHATDFRPVYDHVDRADPDGKEQRVWHLTGEIELVGSRGSTDWSVTLYTQNFLEIVLDRIAFNSD
jgi:hypothetical protein